MWDFGDVPDPSYPTLLANNGARHYIDPWIFLGTYIDGEQDGQPSALADGDDLNNLDDEDGVFFNSVLVPGQLAMVVIAANGSGYLNAWMDFSADGDWDDIGEQAITDQMLGPGLNFIIISVPITAQPGYTYSRFRYSSQSGLSYDGSAGDGEVEDYRISIVEIPCSPTCTPTGTPTDTPTNTPTKTPTKTPSYTPTITPTNTPTDTPTDTPSNTPSVTPTDTPTITPSNTPTDTPTDTPSNTPSVTPTDTPTITPTNTPTDTPTDTPSNTPSVTPTDTPTITPSNTPTDTPTPSPPEVPTDPPTSTPTNTPCPYDFGDAPDSFYRTLLISNGARHTIDRTIYLGVNIDADLDGQPSFLSDGDDFDGNDDEDGVVFTTFIVQGYLAMISVGATGSGYFSGWIDFNMDGDWDDIGERIFNDQPLAPGVSNLFFWVPASAQPGFTHARFRFSRQMGLMSYGCAQDGEVEDYLVHILEDLCPSPCPPTGTCPCETTPTMTPTNTPTDSPPEVPTDQPTDTPTPYCPPTDTPTCGPCRPTKTPTSTPTDSPPSVPTDPPTETPTEKPSCTPTCTPCAGIWRCGYRWEFNTDGDKEGWYSNSRCVDVNCSDGCLKAKVAGPYATLYSPRGLNIDADTWFVVEFRLKMSAGDCVRVGYKKNGTGFWSCPIAVETNDEFVTYRYCFGADSNYSDTIDQFKIVPYAPVGTRICLDYFKVCKCVEPLDKLWEFPINNNFQGWSVVKDIDPVCVFGNCLSGTTTGPDPILKSPSALNIDADACSKVEVRMRVTSGDCIDLFFADFGQGFSGLRRKRVMISPSPDYQTYEFDMSTISTWTGNVDKIRLDPTNVSGADVQIDYIIVY